MNRIKEARKNAGIKQTDLCARLGISQGALSGYENGKFEPDSSVWLRLSQIFNVSVDYLMGGNYAPPAASSLSLEDVALLRKFHALDDMAQARILNSLDFEYQAATRQECAESSISPA